MTATPNQFYFLVLHAGTLLVLTSVHGLRGVLTLGPVLALGGLFTFLVWQVAQAGWWVQWDGLTINAAHLGIMPAIILGGVLIYAMDGVKLGRAYTVVVAGTALLATGYVEFLASLGSVVPLPNFIFQSLQSQIALTIALVVGVLGGMVAYEGSRRLIPWRLALAVGVSAGLALVLLVTSYASYGLTVGLVNVRNEMLEYSLALVLPVLVALAYGALAGHRGWIMPARPVQRLFAVWQSSEEEVRQALRSAMEAQHTITELRDLNAALKQEQRLRAHQVDNSPLAVLEVDERGQISTFNKSAATLFSPIAPLEGQTSVETVLPGFQAAFQRGTRVSGVLRVPVNADDVRSLDVTVMPFNRRPSSGDTRRAGGGFSVLVEDVTERERARVRSQIVSRMRGVHMASRVVAHDFSNLVTAIEANIASIRAQLPSAEHQRVGPSLEAIRDAANRARAMLGQLGGEQIFERPELRPHNLKSLIHEAVGMERPDMETSGITLRVEPLADMTVEVDSTQIVRVLINLLRNAVRATPSGGTIAVSTVLGPETVEIVVEDTGVGMSSRALSQAFQPGYSTKGHGEGGLGLPISFLILDAHGGRLTLTSKPGHGTRATMRLNRTRGGAEPPSVSRLDGLRILVLDDNDHRRESIVDGLAPLGALVDEMMSLEELTAWLDEESASWDLVLHAASLTPRALRATLCTAPLPDAGQPPMVLPSCAHKLNSEQIKTIARVVGASTLEGV